jgi:hypothetical protein
MVMVLHLPLLVLCKQACAVPDMLAHGICAVVLHRAR